VNNTAAKMLGYSIEELQFLGIKGIDTYLSIEQVEALMNRVAFGETQVFETEHTAKNGAQIPVEISSSLITYHGTKAILSIARNIMERKKAEEELKKNQVKMEIMNEKLNVVAG
jgi:PAS domain S-box-containing protein